MLLSSRLKRDCVVAEAGRSDTLVSSCARNRKSNRAPHFSTAQDYTRSIERRSRIHVPYACCYSYSDSCLFFLSFFFSVFCFFLFILILVMRLRILLIRLHVIVIILRFLLVRLLFLRLVLISIFILQCRLLGILILSLIYL